MTIYDMTIKQLIGFICNNDQDLIKEKTAQYQRGDLSYDDLIDVATDTIDRHSWNFLVDKVMRRVRCIAVSIRYIFKQGQILWN